MGKKEFMKQLEDQGDLPVMPSVDDIIRYEGGEMDSNEIVVFFAGMIKTGVCWKLQGSYGRTAAHLISNKYITKEGEILFPIED